jgi:hypothetical protein
VVRDLISLSNIVLNIHTSLEVFNERRGTKAGNYWNLKQICDDLQVVRNHILCHCSSDDIKENDLMLSARIHYHDTLDKAIDSAKDNEHFLGAFVNLLVKELNDEYTEEFMKNEAYKRKQK